MSGRRRSTNLALPPYQSYHIEQGRGVWSQVHARIFAYPIELVFVSGRGPNHSPTRHRVGQRLARQLALVALRARHRALAIPVHGELPAGRARAALGAVHRQVGHHPGHDTTGNDCRQRSLALGARFVALAQLFHACAAETEAAVVIRVRLRLVQSVCAHGADELFVHWQAWQARMPRKFVGSRTITIEQSPNLGRMLWSDDLFQMTSAPGAHHPAPTKTGRNEGRKEGRTEGRIPPGYPPDTRTCLPRHPYPPDTPPPPRTTPPDNPRCG